MLLIKEIGYGRYSEMALTFIHSNFLLKWVSYTAKVGKLKWHFKNSLEAEVEGEN